MRLKYFDYFRAIAIVLIVAGHSTPPWAIDSIPEMVFANVITGGTALFVFMSGFFFHHVFYKNFHYQHFLIKKSKNVLLPYIILSIIGFFLIIIFLDMPHQLLTRELNEPYDILALLTQYLWTGRTLTAYWYIPFIMIIFFMSPIFIIYIKLSIHQQVVIFLFTLCASMLIHRPLANLSPIHSVIYYFPIYLFGIIFSIQRYRLLGYLKNKVLILGIAVIIISLVQVVFYGTYKNFHKESIASFNGVDIIIIQKILLILFFLAILQRIAKKEIPILKYIASISFPIFFLHPFVLFFFSYYSVVNYVTFLPGIVIFAIKTMLVLGVSIILANLIKFILHSKSIYIIGW